MASHLGSELDEIHLRLMEDNRLIVAFPVGPAVPLHSPLGVPYSAVSSSRSLSEISPQELMVFDSS